MPTISYRLKTINHQLSSSPPLNACLNYGILLIIMMKASALAHPNIAFIKYWGMIDEDRRLPANDSLSMNIGCLSTRTAVTLDPQLSEDVLVLNGEAVSGTAQKRVQAFMDHIRQQADNPAYTLVESTNNFPIGAGLASSASAFAALALAGSTAFGLNLSEKALSSLARFGSGSACRSIPGGFVEWHTDPETGESYASSIVHPDHWKLIDCIAILSDEHKPVGSEAGMKTAESSPLQQTRVLDAPRRLEACREAILQRDFAALADITELDSNLMHAVMMTSDPPLFYWHPQSLALMKAVRAWRAEGLNAAYTLDAGPNVHVICTQDSMGEILSRLRHFPAVIDVITGLPAGPARLLT